MAEKESFGRRFIKAAKILFNFPNERKPKDTSGLPRSRSSERDVYDQNYVNLQKGLKVITPDFEIECIKELRRLYKVNEDVGLVVFDAIQLTNTGHRIMFDESIPVKTANKMREHLVSASKNWGQGVAGVDGLVNKMIAQIYIGGAISNEWVINRDLSGVDYLAFINPENIRFVYTSNPSRYKPYQVKRRNKSGKYLRKLNTNSYNYLALYSDEDSPHGVPPLMTALDAIAVQKDMKTNIKHIMKQQGLMGFLEMLMAKPDQKANESDTDYNARVTRLLEDAKVAIKDGMIDGVMVGYEEDHEFQFHSTTKNMGGVSDVFSQNQVQVANGLKTSPGFMGQKQGGTENSTGITFTKMLSQLRNVQQVVAANLEMGYRLELLLNGYDPKGLKVKFSASTISDDLKVQQAMEIKIRNLSELYKMGIISLETYSQEMEYGLPDQNEPRMELLNPGKGGEEDPQVKKRERKKDKNDTERRKRDKNNPNPKRKDNDTRKP